MTDFTRHNRVRALCSDGVERSALILREADTFFSTPTRVSVNGRTVTGSIYYRFQSTSFEFSADSWRANANALPRWSATA